MKLEPSYTKEQSMFYIFLFFFYFAWSQTDTQIHCDRIVKKSPSARHLNEFIWVYRLVECSSSLIMAAVSQLKKLSF